MTCYDFVIFGVSMVLFGPVVIDAKLFQGQKLNGNVFHTLLNVNAMACKQECDIRHECLSYNYNRYFHLCELNNANHNSRVGMGLDFSKAWVYQLMKKDDNFGKRECNKISCAENEGCRETRPGHKCVIEECSPYKIGSEIELIHGNMNNIDSVLKLYCKSGYKMNGNNTIFCNESGQWVVSYHKCIKTCPSFNNFVQSMIFNVQSANIITIDTVIKYTITSSVRGWPEELKRSSVIFEHSMVLYQCTGFSSKVLSLFCMDGLWSFTPECYDPSLKIPCHADIKNVGNLCQCPFGTAYSYSELKCVIRCSGNLADDFTRHPNYAFYRSDYLNIIDQFFNVTLGQCRSSCLYTYASKCLSFDHVSTFCDIWNFVYADHPYDLRKYSGDFYMRNCE